MQDYILLINELIIWGKCHHLALEGLLFLLGLWLICKKNYKEYPELTESEKIAAIKAFDPEPLVTEVPVSHPALKPKIIQGKAGKYIVVDNYECLNFATHNFLGFIGDQNIEEKAIKSIDKYGVGSCGPRLFYGTSEVHLELEKQLADFMGTEDAILYSYAFSTVSSAIPAYAKRSDIVFVDEKANFAIQKGLDSSRSTVKSFKHNDVEDLVRILEETSMEDQGNIKRAQRSRRFLVIEGIYANTGLICPLPLLLDVCRKYKLRIFIDESLSFGVLGTTGRGVTEYFDIPRCEVDLIMVSLENSLAAIGGFCVGTSFIVDHQRLSGLGYCFSASLPPFLAIATMEALKTVDKHPQMLVRLRHLSQEMHERLNDSDIITEHFTLSGDADSPVQLLELKPNHDPEGRQPSLSNFVDYCFLAGRAISQASFLADVDKGRHAECLRITISILHSDEEIHDLVNTLEWACESFLFLQSIETQCKPSTNL